MSNSVISYLDTGAVEIELLKLQDKGICS